MQPQRQVPLAQFLENPSETVSVLDGIDLSIIDDVLSETERSKTDLPRAAPKHGDCHHKLVVTDEQRANLQKLAEFLWYLKPTQKRRFHMDVYHSPHTTNTSTDCGAVGCAVGWAPRAGIKKSKDETWSEFANDKFANNIDYIWRWCFDNNWKFKDNTPRGAAERILYALAHGVPCNFTEQEFYDDVPLTYKTNG